MDTVFFAGVDDNLDFPPEIRIALAASPELRNTIVSMSQAARDNLKEENLWHGRPIYNRNKKIIEIFNAEEYRWIQYFAEDSTFPVPPLPWDDQFNLPQEVIERLSQSDEFKHLIVPMPTSVRDQLSSSERWNGRTIFNTTTRSLEVWTTLTNTWSKVINADTYPYTSTWDSWNPLGYLDDTPMRTDGLSFTSRGKFLKQGKRITARYYIHFYNSALMGYMPDEGVNMHYRMSLPAFNAAPYNLDFMARSLRDDGDTFANGFYNGLAVLPGGSQLVHFEFSYIQNGFLQPALRGEYNNSRWYGQIIYETS